MLKGIDIFFHFYFSFIPPLYLQELFNFLFIKAAANFTCWNTCINPAPMCLAKADALRELQP